MTSKTSTQLILGLALSLLSALLLWLGFTLKNLGILIFVAFVPMLVAQHVVLPDRSSPLGPALSISIWLGAIIIPAFQGKSLGMVLLPLAFFFLSFAINLNTRKDNERENYRRFVLSGIAGWVGMELLRSFIPVLGTWAFVGYALWDYPRLIQPVSIVGIYGLDLVIMFANYGLALFLIRIAKSWNQTEAAQRQAAYRIGFLTLIGLAVWIGSSLVLFHFRTDGENTVRVAAVQPGLPVAAHLDQVHTQEERIDILADLTRQAAQAGAELIVWPEMVLGFDPQQEFTRELQDLAQQVQAFLVLGYVVEDQLGFRNQAVLLSPERQFVAVYSKTHPMLASGEPRSLGTGIYPVVDTPIGRVGMMICFDNSFTDVARALGKQKVQVIANPSLLGPSIADLMPPMGAFRSLETRSVVIMADTAYMSAIFDPRGRMVAASPSAIEGPAILVADVSISPGGTLSSNIGDILGWASVLCLVVFGVSDFIHNRVPHAPVKDRTS